MREKLISFLPDQFPEPDAFFVELTGVTYPDPRYRIDRDRSPVLPPSARHPFARARFALHPAGQPARPGGAGPGASGPLAVRGGHGGRSGRRRGTFPLSAHAGVCRPLRRNALPLSAFPPPGNGAPAAARHRPARAGDRLPSVLFGRALFFLPLPPQDGANPFGIPPGSRQKNFVKKRWDPLDLECTPYLILKASQQQKRSDNA